MKTIKFTLEKRVNERTGQQEDALIKHEIDENGVDVEEQWCTIPELDRLFDVCSRRWEENGWDLEKLIVCVNECDFE